MGLYTSRGNKGFGSSDQQEQALALVDEDDDAYFGEFDECECYVTTMFNENEEPEVIRSLDIPMDRRKRTGLFARDEYVYCRRMNEPVSDAAILTLLRN